MKNRNGFTLIEVIVILVIIGIGMTAGITGYTKQVRESQLKRDADQVSDDLDRARQMTISRDVRGGTCATLSYSVAFTANSGEYQIIQNCDLTPIALPASHLDSTVSDTTIQVDFTEPYGMAQASTSIVLEHPSLKLCRQIDVPQNGAVNISDSMECL